MMYSHCWWRCCDKSGVDIVWFGEGRGRAEEKCFKEIEKLEVELKQCSTFIRAIFVLHDSCSCIALHSTLL